MAVIRAAISGVAAATGLDDELLANLKTAVSEACNNVCLHAYPEGETGPMLVAIECLSHGVKVVIRDHGHGITRISSRSDRMGLGLAVINALSDRAEFRSLPGGGTEVRILFSQPISAVSAASAPTPATPGKAEPPAPPAELDESAAAWLDAMVRLWCNTAELQRHVLARVLTLIAASAHFSVTSADDLAAANEAIADHVERRADGWVGVGIDSSPRRLRLSVGPLEPVPDPDGRLKRAVESVKSEPLDSHCVIHLTIADRQTTG